MRPMLLIALLALAAPAAARAPSIPVADHPELAALGPHGVGYITAEIASGGRTLPVWFWYPARPPADAPRQSYRRAVQPDAGGAPVETVTEGIAVAAPAAPPAAGRFPLVILSHGFGSWAGQWTYLAENLASKGYAVAAVDHADGQGPGATPEGRARVGIAVANRARDQQRLLAALTQLTRLSGNFIGQRVDASRIAVIGFSMGGFGALATGGAGYELSAGAPKLVGAALRDQAAGARRPDPRIKAVIAFAPWGGQPEYRAWTPAGLAGLTVPTLFVAGDRDDTSGYADGVRWLWDNARAAPRWLLTYANARHGVGGNPPPAEAATDPRLAGWTEPVWRPERIAAINQHFVTAFLDRHLKGDTAKARYLDVTGDTGWPGFTPRALLGLKLERQAAGE